MVSVTLVEPQSPARAEFVQTLATAPGVRLRRSAAIPSEPPPDVVLVYLSTLDGDVSEDLRVLRGQFADLPVLVAMPGTDLSPSSAAATLAALAGTTRGGARDRDADVLAAATAVSRLSPIERQMLQLIADGLTNPEIAGHLGLASQTVKNYVSAIFTKLGVSRRTEAAVLFTRASLDHERPGMPVSPADRDHADDVALLMRDLRARIHRMERVISRVTGANASRQRARRPLRGATDLA